MKTKIDKIWKQEKKSLCDQIRIYLTGRQVSKFPFKLKNLKSGMKLTQDILAKIDDSDLFNLTMKTETANITLYEFYKKGETLERIESDMLSLNNIDDGTALFEAYLVMAENNNEIKKLKSTISHAQTILSTKYF